MCIYVVALACSILGTWISSDANKLSRNISSEDVDISDFCTLNLLLRLFWDKIWAWECDKENLCKPADLW
jgi:hypothetical protein